ncbi:hypothetical protein ACFL0W_04185 [Nanoarchaeota archaeon]
MTDKHHPSDSSLLLAIVGVFAVVGILFMAFGSTCTQEVSQQELTESEIVELEQEALQTGELSESDLTGMAPTRYCNWLTEKCKDLNANYCKTDYYTRVCGKKPSCAKEGEFATKDLKCCKGLSGFIPTMIHVPLCYNPKYGRPVCKFGGTESEGWYYSDAVSDKLLRYDDCTKETVGLLEIATEEEPCVEKTFRLSKPKGEYYYGAEKCVNDNWIDISGADTSLPPLMVAPVFEPKIENSSYYRVQTCTKTDNNPDYRKRGTLTAINEDGKFWDGESEDRCHYHDGTLMLELVCYQKEGYAMIYFENVDCGPGYTCSKNAGACVRGETLVPIAEEDAPKIKCTDDDPDNNISKKGTVKILSGKHITYLSQYGTEIIGDEAIIAGAYLHPSYEGSVRVKVGDTILNPVGGVMKVLEFSKKNPDDEELSVKLRYVQISDYCQEPNGLQQMNCAEEYDEVYDYVHINSGPCPEDLVCSDGACVTESVVQQPIAEEEARLPGEYMGTLTTIQRGSITLYTNEYEGMSHAETWLDLLPRDTENEQVRAECSPSWVNSWGSSYCETDCVCTSRGIIELKCPDLYKGKYFFVPEGIMKGEGSNGFALKCTNTNTWKRTSYEENKEIHGW